MTPQDFVHLPSDILGDAYILPVWIVEAESLTTDTTVQKNIVAFRYWEAVNNKMMMNPSTRTRGPISDSYSKDQLDFFREQYEVYRSSLSGLNPPIVPIRSSGGAVLTEAC